MRNPNRLDDFYKTLHWLHKTYIPDWRFGQYMSNFLGWCIATGKCSDIFFPEDDNMRSWAIEFIEKTCAIKITDSDIPK